MEISNLNNKIDNMFEFILAFTKMIIPIMVGPSVIKQQLSLLSKTNINPLRQLKVLFMSW